MYREVPASWLLKWIESDVIGVADLPRKWVARRKCSGDLGPELLPRHKYGSRLQRHELGHRVAVDGDPQTLPRLNPAKESRGVISERTLGNICSHMATL